MKTHARFIIGGRVQQVGKHTEKQFSQERSKAKSKDGAAAAAAAKSLQSCPTLCDPIDGSQPGSPIPGIL